MDKAADGSIPLARPSLGEPELQAAARCLRSGRLVLGPENQRFEAGLAARAGRAHAICVSSGSTALELALWALDSVGPGDQVLVPASGFPAAAHAVLRLGATPVPVDIDAHTWTMDPVAARAALGERTRALISVDSLGLVAEVEPLRALCHDAGIALIDDAACALGGSDSQGILGGGYGVLGTFSFHPRKVITTGEGGAIVCDDDDLARRLRALRNHGQETRGRFERAGTNARLPEVAAAMGCVQLERLDAMLDERRALVAGYRQRLAALRDAGRLRWQEAPAGARPTHQTFAVLLAPDADRDRVQAHLAAARIETTVASYATSRLDSLRRAGVAGGSYPVAEALDERGLALPLYLGMRSSDLDRVCDTLREVLA